MELWEELAQVVDAGDALLFAGAGCSARIGLPVWGAYLESLAAQAERFEPETAVLMRKRIASGELLAAATLFRRFLQAPPGEILAAISMPFKPGTYNFTPLAPLASLPFSGVVTTNYDSSLFEARMHIASRDKLTPPQLLVTRETHGAPYCTVPFVLFLHGRASIPTQAEQIVFDTQDYQACYSNPAFTDGLLQLLSSRTCVFVGFSFKDPGIEAVLNTWISLKGPAFPKTHLALIPKSAASLTSKLTAMNVRVATYNDAVTGHGELWDAISRAASYLSGARPTSAAHRLRRTPLTSARDMLSLCYARASLKRTIEPLRTVVLDGVALAEIANKPDKQVDLETLRTAVSQALGMLPTEVDAQLDASLQRLQSLGLLEVKQGLIHRKFAPSDEVAPKTQRLAESVMRRIALREGITLPSSCVTPIAQGLEDLLIARAWDLAAHFIQPRSGSLHGVEESVAEVFDAGEYLKPKDMPALRRGVMDLLGRPSGPEAEILADLGRLAFAIQLALGSARSSLAYATTLPQRLYLDASILMPAIVVGHPMHAVYWPVLQRLRAQTSATGGEASVIAPTEFLNEVLSHRRNAIREARVRGLGDPKRLEREILIYGAENVNVFLGAYATHVGRGKTALSFEQFLLEHAPYNTEKQLLQYLGKLGIRVEALESSAGHAEMLRWHNSLKTWYEEVDHSWRGRVKQDVLVEHEAWQLARIVADHRDGIRAVFVTADGRLRRAVAVINEGELADALLSGVILVKLIDLLLGAKFDHRGLARLIWGVHAMDPDGMLRRYFTDRGLQLRGEVETMVLPKVVDEITREAERKIDFRDLDLGVDNTVERAKVSTFLDRFEDRFYELLQEAVERRNAQFDRLQNSEDPAGSGGSGAPPRKTRKSGRKQ